MLVTARESQSPGPLSSAADAILQVILAARIEEPGV